MSQVLNKIKHQNILHYEQAVFWLRNLILKRFLVQQRRLLKIIFWQKFQQKTAEMKS